MMQSSITRSYKKVTPSIFTNEKCSELREAKFFDIQYNLDSSHLDAFDNEEKLPRMAFMDEPTDDMEKLDQEFDDEQYPLVRRQQQRQTKDPFKVANRQEQLFCCGKFGTNCLIINVLQLLYLGAVCSFGIEVFSVKQELLLMSSRDKRMPMQLKMTHASIILTNLLLVAWICAVMVPDTLIKYTVASNVSTPHFLYLILIFYFIIQVEMMKDRECIRKVIQL